MSSGETFSLGIHQQLDARGDANGRGSRLCVEGDGPWSLAVRVYWEGVGEVRINPASQGDKEALKKFVLALSERSRFLFSPYPVDDRLDVALGRVLLACEQKKDLVLHAWREGEIIGHFFLDGLDRTRPELGIAVAETCQGKKMGAFFIALLQGCALWLDRPEIGLTTHPTNDAGFNLYLKMGFEHVGERLIGVSDSSQRWERDMMYVQPGLGRGHETGDGSLDTMKK